MCGRYGKRSGDKGESDGNEGSGQREPLSATSRRAPAAGSERASSAELPSDHTSAFLLLLTPFPSSFSLLPSLPFLPAGSRPPHSRLPNAPTMILSGTSSRSYAALQLLYTCGAIVGLFSLLALVRTGSDGSISGRITTYCVSSLRLLPSFSPATRPVQRTIC